MNMYEQLANASADSVIQQHTYRTITIQKHGFLWLLTNWTTTITCQPQRNM
jgi:hypothetical protein